MSLKVVKTQSLVTSTKCKQAVLKDQIAELALNICDTPTEVVQSIKYLGVHIDSSLDWQKHIQEISKRISQSLG